MNLFLVRRERLGVRLLLAFILAAVCAVTSGCMLGPDFKRPAAPTNVKSYTTDPQPSNTVASDAKAGTSQTFHSSADIPREWWRLFQSETLNRYIVRAVQQNPDLRAAKAALNAAREQVIAKEGSLFPAIDVSGNGRRQKTAGALFGNPGFAGSTFSLFNASVNVAYTLDVFGGVRRSIEGMAAQAEYQQFQAEGVYITLTANVVTSALQEASFDVQVKLTEELIDEQAEQLGMVKRQLQLGGASQVDVLSQQALLEQTRAALPLLRSQLAQQHHHLMILLGNPPGTASAPIDLKGLTLPKDLPVSLPSKLVEQRPDIRAREAMLHSASAQIGVATAKMLPDFTISANIGTIATRIGDLFVPGSAIWSTGLNILQPVFHGGELIHQRRAAVAAYEEAASQYQSTVLMAWQNVADVLRALEADAKELQVQDAANLVAKEGLEIAHQQFDVGAISYLSLLDAERNFRQSQIAVVKAQVARFADSAALFLALGGGWWNPSQTEGANIGSSERTLFDGNSERS